jgi:hypothetical protein
LPAVWIIFEGQKVRVNIISPITNGYKVAGQAVKGFNGFTRHLLMKMWLGNASALYRANYTVLCFQI